MDRDLRERDRGVARSDVASLWIDFLLLPEKLEEHLAAGCSAVPPPPDLITMFLDQALVNHKAAQGNYSSANGLNKDAEPCPGPPRVTSRTASLLCERAARVVVVMRYTLSDIETSVPSQLHQFVLLKALIRHDKSRVVIHQCNLHRWLIHKALQSHPIGSASPNVVVPANRLGSWIAGDDLGEVFHGAVNGSADPPVAGCGDPQLEEERASVEFLEKILNEDIKNEEAAISRTDSNLQKVVANGGPDSGQALSTSYKCQVILDVAEVYFMRGRIRKAHELFSKCGEMLNSLSVSIHSSGGENGEGFPVTSTSDISNSASSSEGSPVPRDRLAGFLVACKMLLGTTSDGNWVETIRSVKRSATSEPSSVAFPGPSQRAIISCEQSRWAARKHTSKVTSRSAIANGDSGCSDFSSGRENMEASISGRTSTDMTGSALEDSNAHHRSNRNKRRTYHEEANGDMVQSEAQADKEEGFSGDTNRPRKEAEHVEASADKMHVDEHSVIAKANSETSLSNGDKGRGYQRNNSETQGINWDSQSVNGPNTGDKGPQMGVDTVKELIIVSTDADCGPGVDLFVDLNGDPAADDVFAKLISDMKYTSTAIQEKRLIKAFVEDILTGYLSWPYCLAVERDLQLSRPVRSQLAACNVARSVLEGAPVETFLRTRGHFENNEESVDFLMQLLVAIKSKQVGFSVGRSLPEKDSRQNRGLDKPAYKRNLIGLGVKDIDASEVARRVHDLAMYACCVIDKPWCWGSSVKLGLVAEGDLTRFLGQLPQNTLKDVEGSGIFLKADAQQENLETSVPRIEDEVLIFEREVLLGFVQANGIHELETLVRKVKNALEKVRKGKSASVHESLHKLAHTERNSERCQSPNQSDSVKRSHSQTASNSWMASNKSLTGQDRDQCSILEAEISAILRRRAFNAIEFIDDFLAAKRLYELALVFQPRDCDSAMMFWLLERCTEPEGQDPSQVTGEMPEKMEGLLPSLGLLDFVILKLIEKELWRALCELCKWAVSLVLKEPMGRDGEQGKSTGKEVARSSRGPGGSVETEDMSNTAGWQSRHKRLLQTLNIARTVVDLMPLCVSLQTAVSRNHFNEDVARLGTTLSQLFEEFLCFLVGIESEGLARGSDDAGQWRHGQLGLGVSVHAGTPGVSLISRVSNPRVLMSLASLTAGWLQRCHVVGLTPWPLAVERYGVLAGVTAGASLPAPVGSLPYPANVLRPVPPRVAPEFVRGLFTVLLEGIVCLPGVVEGDREKGHRWLQGLADLAFEEEAHVKALRLYLQAGAIRSAQYCDRASSMNRDIFTPWVIQRMVAACRSIGAGIQAAVLCQCLPVPDHETAFRILQENILIMDRDAAAYFECLWEVPILELLVHLHSRSGDEVRVQKLIGLLQQPALNVHNPSAIRQAHISTMEQRFLQRLAGELL